MKNKSGITLLVSLIFTFTTSFGQDVKAKKILDDLSAKTKTYSSMSASFEYKMLNESEGIDENQKGSLTVKGDNYHLEIAGQKIISDGKTVWTVLDEAEEVQVNSVPQGDDVEDFISPTKILTLWEKGFKYGYDSESKLNGAAVDIINLFPEKADEKSFHTIKLYVNKAKKEVDQIVIKGKDGTDFIYSIKEFESNKDIPSANFTFKNTANYDVIDLR
jgi:outer membrane lipoprotein-sorting protein